MGGAGGPVPAACAGRDQTRLSETAVSAWQGGYPDALRQVWSAVTVRTGISQRSAGLPRPGS